MSLLVVETKSSSEDIAPGATYWKRLRMDRQIGVYWRAAIQMGMDIRGIGYDVLGRPLLRPLKATPIESRKYTKPTKNDPVSRLYANQRDRDETPEEYGARCLAAIIAEPDTYYQRAIPVRLFQEQHECAVDVWQTSQNMREARRLNVFPRNPDACFQWNRSCDFLSVCAGDVPIDDPLLFRRQERENEELEDVFEDDRVLLTQSSMRTFQACARRYKHRYIDRAKPVVKPDALRSGSSIHAGVEALRKGASLDEACEKLDREDPFDWARARAMLIGYLSRWGDPTRGIVAVEKEFQIELVNPTTGKSSKTFLLAGKMDAIFDGDEREFLGGGPTNTSPTLVAGTEV